MASGHVGQAIRGLERLWTGGSVTGVSEVQLLERFVARRDAAAFEALVARHGAMVLGVCRQRLRDSHDVEDAFQATFLVLVKKASTLRDRELLGNWLYGVAYRVATRARCASARRRAREAEGLEDVADGRALEGPDSCAWLHDEVHRLPEKYRAPIVLCYLEGLTHEQAAEQLQWPLGTVKGRLSRAREVLRSRLARRGLAPSFGALLVLLSRDAKAAVPPALVDRTISASCAAAGHAIAAGTISAQVAALSKGVSHAMFLSRLTGATAFLAIAALVATGAGVVANQTGQRGPETPGAGLAAAADGHGPIAGAPEAANPPASGTKPEAKHVADEGGTVPETGSGDPEVDIARQAIATMETIRKQGQPTDLDQFYAWSDRLLAAEQRAAGSPADRRAAAEAHRTRMKQALDQTSEAFQQGRVALLKLLDAQFRFEQAKHAATPGSGTADPAMANPRSSPPSQDGGDEAMSPGMPAMMRGPMGGPGGRAMESMMRGAMGRPGGMLGPPGASGGSSNMYSGMMGSGGGRGTTRGGASAAGGGGSNEAMAMAGFGGMGIDEGAQEHSRRIQPAQSSTSAESLEDSPLSAATRKKLESPLTMSFADGVPLAEVLKYIKSATAKDGDKGIQIYIDPNGLEEANTTVDAPIMLDLEGIPLKTTLRLALKQLGLAYCVKDGVLMISSVEGIHRELQESESAQKQSQPQ